MHLDTFARYTKKRLIFWFNNVFWNGEGEWVGSHGNESLILNWLQLYLPMPNTYKKSMQKNKEPITENNNFKISFIEISLSL